MDQGLCDFVTMSYRLWLHSGGKLAAVARSWAVTSFFSQTALGIGEFAEALCVYVCLCGCLYFHTPLQHRIVPYFLPMNAGHKKWHNGSYISGDYVCMCVNVCVYVCVFTCALAGVIEWDLQGPLSVVCQAFVSSHRELQHRGDPS